MFKLALAAVVSLLFAFQPVHAAGAGAGAGAGASKSDTVKKKQKRSSAKKTVRKK